MDKFLPFDFLKLVSIYFLLQITTGAQNITKQTRRSTRFLGLAK